jgi:hypothetical protein
MYQSVEHCALSLLRHLFYDPEDVGDIFLEKSLDLYLITWRYISSAQPPL